MTQEKHCNITLQNGDHLHWIVLVPINKFNLGLQILTVKIHVTVFWVMTSCSDVAGYQSFRGPCSLHLQGEAWFSEILVSYHITTWCQDPEDHDMNTT
jgi:hypothetical protein